MKSHAVIAGNESVGVIVKYQASQDGACVAMSGIRRAGPGKTFIFTNLLVSQGGKKESLLQAHLRLLHPLPTYLFNLRDALKFTKPRLGYASSQSGNCSC
eukprot:scaffold63204_cov16-Tisochrysis_lutea.AAC.1